MRSADSAGQPLFDQDPPSLTGPFGDEQLRPEHLDLGMQPACIDGEFNALILNLGQLLAPSTFSRAMARKLVVRCPLPDLVQRFRWIAGQGTETSFADAVLRSAI